MANSFGSLYVGASGIQSASNGLNTTANNLSNVNTEGYVREQVIYADRDYIKFGNAAVSSQYAGLGVQIGTIVHARDVFLDKAYRTENGRYSFYSASSEAVQEVYTHLQESDGEAFKNAIADLEEAFEEFAKDPSDTVNQNLILQKSSLFLSRASAVQQGLEDYQSIINSKIREDINRINEIGNKIVDLNKRIQTIEAAKVEKAMDLRDQRDLLLDELSGLVSISYEEDPRSVVSIQIEGVEFVDEINCNEIGVSTDLLTGFVHPYWIHLSNLDDEDDPHYYPVFNLENIAADKNTDIGEVKALLLARGDEWADYTDFYNEDGTSVLTADEYNDGISNSVMMNTEAELDTLVHRIMTDINNLFSPLLSVAEASTDEPVTITYMNGQTQVSSDVTAMSYTYYRDIMDENGIARSATVNVTTNGDGTATKTTTYTDENGLVQTYSVNTDAEFRILDLANSSVGTDGELPPRELFVRNGSDRYNLTTVTFTDTDGNENTAQIYVYIEEDKDDSTTLYSLKTSHVNEDLQKQEAFIPHRMFADQEEINYSMGQALSALWNDSQFNLNPSDTTPCGFNGFYTKWIGEVGNTGSVYATTEASLQGTKEEIESSRQGVIGVSSDEELSSIIKYQSAYNASSRYINVINEMIEHLLNSLGG
ncbi:MAG: flagellar basal body protein [Pseudobutyrivibrio sp.]|nr:flagellar basal body protein [Pseudobutyrivibrio sp.]